MIQGTGGERFLGKAPLAIGVQRCGVVEDLDGDEALQPRIAAAIHLPHAAGGQGADDFVGSKSRGELGHLVGRTAEDTPGGAGINECAISNRRRRHSAIGADAAPSPGVT